VKGLFVSNSMGWLGRVVAALEMGEEEDEERWLLFAA
jgi:hypothetical protein